MRVPTDLIHEAKCSVCCAPSIMECVECIKEDTKCNEAPSFCSSKCYSKHFSAHRQRSFGSKRSSSSSGSSSISSGSSSPSLGSSSEPSSPSSPLMGFQQQQQQHSPAQGHYVQQFIHMQPPPPRGYHAPVMMHRHPIEVGGPAPYWQQHHRRR